jgi:biopolymer transport protein ExbD
MPGLMKRKHREEPEVEVDMVPIMNMFLVLVPFLLMSASFLHIKAINTSVPVLAAASKQKQTDPSLKTTVVLELSKMAIDLSLQADVLKPEEATKWRRQFQKQTDDTFPLALMADQLGRVKSAYPASDTLIIVPDGDVLYDTIIQIMDMARYGEAESKLFPNVVISGKIG